MNREIKFRGKRLDNGEWMYGNYAKYKDYSDNVHESMIDKDGYMHDIVPSTVGQYTGLKDRNGKEIYEGDILNVQFGTEQTVLMFVSFVDGGWHIQEDLDYEEYHYLYDYKDDATIIGNIHDNPELIRASSPATVILDALPHLEWMAENLTGHGGTEVDGRWYYTFDEAMEAAKQLGDGWRLPTREEFQALVDTGAVWDVERKGMLFGGKLFLEAAGYRHYSSGALACVGGSGYCWSSSPYSWADADACFLGFHSGRAIPVGNSNRVFGFTVRLVREIKA